MIYVSPCGWLVIFFLDWIKWIGSTCRIVVGFSYFLIYMSQDKWVCFTCLVVVGYSYFLSL